MKPAACEVSVALRTGGKEAGRLAWLHPNAKKKKEEKVCLPATVKLDITVSYAVFTKSQVQPYFTVAV